MHHHESAHSEKNAAPGTVYSCPMHSDIVQDKPGLCPACGMALLPGGSKESHHHHRHKKDRGKEESFNKHEGHNVNIFKLRFWVSLILTLPVVAYSDLPRHLFGWSAPVFPGSSYIGLVLGSIIYFYGGWVFLIGAWRELRARLPGMMTLIGIAESAAYFFSVYAVLFNAGESLFWELTSLITIMLLGHWIEMRAVQGAQGALKELSKLLPDTAEVVRGDKTIVVPLEELHVGDIVMVRPGGKIPADGVIVDGNSDVNESIITGESKPVHKGESDEIIAGSINGDGALRIRVAKIGEKTFLAGVKRLVMEAQASKSRLQLLSDRAAFYLTLIALTAGGITFGAWMWAGAGLVFSIARLVAVLVIACPHALGLAVPLVASISTTMAARNGLLVKQRLALEAARSVGTVLFDKTGTLTKGEYGVGKIWAVAAKNEKEVLHLAASVDARSEHFIAQAIVREAKKRGIILTDVKDFARIPGKGVKARLNNDEVFIGSMRLVEEANIELPGALRKEISAESSKGKTVVFVLNNHRVVGVLALSDAVRPESREAVQLLKDAGVKVAMITGDTDDVAAWVAKDLGIDEYFARVLPEQKSDKVKLLQQKGQKVAMVGDGINDAPALTQADLGIAIGAGTNVAIESAGIILVKDDPRDIMKIIRLSRLTYAKMIQNLFWATGYNAIALPLGAGVLASQGIILQPAVAAIFMSLSTVIVAVNAVLMRRKAL